MTDSIVEAARFLRTQLDWLRHALDEQGNPYAATVFAEIGECASRLRSTVDGPREQKYLGPCGALIEPPECNPIRHAPDCPQDCGIAYPCEGDVYGVAGAQSGRCRTC